MRQSRARPLELERLPNSHAAPAHPSPSRSSQASIAILNAVLNIKAEGVTLGDELSNLEAFSKGLDPQMAGEIITNSDKIRTGKLARHPHRSCHTELTLLPRARSAQLVRAQ